MYRWIVTIGVVVVLLASGAWKAHHSGIVKGRAEVRVDWDRAKLQAIEKREINRDTARKAEIRYIDRDKFRVETITEIIRELPNETANLRSCRLDAGDVRLLNEAAVTASKY